MYIDLFMNTFIYHGVVTYFQSCYSKRGIGTHVSVRYGESLQNCVYRKLNLHFVRQANIMLCLLSGRCMYVRMSSCTFSTYQLEFKPAASCQWSAVVVNDGKVAKWFGQGGGWRNIHGFLKCNIWLFCMFLDI